MTGTKAFSAGKITLVGGAGFIGHAVANELILHGNAVTVIDHVPRPPTLHSAAIYYEVDAAAPAALRGMLSNSTAVVLLAGSLHAGCTRSPAYGWRSNVLTVVNTIDELYSAGGGQGLIYFSSSSVYETARPNLECGYSTSKRTGEHLLRMAGISLGLRSVILRPFTVYGPGPASGYKGHFIAAWTERCRVGSPLPIHGDGRQRVDLVHVEDVARLCRLLIVRDLFDTSAPAFDVGGGSALSVTEIGTIFCSEFADVRLEHVPVPSVSKSREVADVAPLFSATGWRPDISPSEGLRSLIRRTASKASA